MSESISQGKTSETEAYQGSNISSVLLAGIFDVRGRGRGREVLVVGCSVKVSGGDYVVM